MKRLIAAITMVVLAGVAGADEKKKFDPASLVGKWKLTAGTKMGEKVEAGNLKAEVTISKDTFTLKDENDKHVMSFKLDTTKSPIQIDMEGKEGPAMGAKAEGIIEFDGKTLKLAYGTNIPGFEGKRPTKFESTKDNKAFYFVLEKAK